MSQEGQDGLKEAPRGPQEDPRSPKGPKMAPRGPKMAPKGPKMAPRCPQKASKGVKMGAKIELKMFLLHLENVEISLVFPMKSRSQRTNDKTQWMKLAHWSTGR